MLIIINLNFNNFWIYRSTLIASIISTMLNSFNVYPPLSLCHLVITFEFTVLVFVFPCLHSRIFRGYLLSSNVTKPSLFHFYHLYNDIPDFAASYLEVFNLPLIVGESILLNRNLLERLHNSFRSQLIFNINEK